MSGSWNYLQSVRGVSLGLASSLRSGSFSTLQDDLNRASRRWDRVEADMRGRYDAAVGEWDDAVRFGTELVEQMDFSNPMAFYDSLQEIVSGLGSYGAALAEAMEWFQKAAQLLLREAPAFAYQVQDQHYAYLDRWIAENILLLRGSNPNASIANMYGRGWFPIYGVRDFSTNGCMNSGPEFGAWSNHGGFTTETENRHLFSLIVGPRENALPPCQVVSDSAMGSWLSSAEGTRSVSAGERLHDLLSRGGFTSASLPGGGPSADGQGRMYRSEGLIFINNMALDLNPGRANYYVWINVVLVNTTKLPDAILQPLAEYIAFRTESEAVTGVIDRERELQILGAAFGGPPYGASQGAAFKQWNILRLIYHGMSRSHRLPINALAEMSRRKSAGVSSQFRPLVGQHTDGSSSTAVAVVGGVSVLALLAWLALK